ncbi:SPRY domain-containing SOCS box protein 4 [Homalodisca vitripennis]|nr:SPRY domain-containing SOCS box protein 4 [Homalodisca vitripennis]
MYPTPRCEGRVGFGQGIHMWVIHWPAQLHGLHPIVGVATKDADLHSNGINSKNLFGVIIAFVVVPIKKRYANVRQKSLLWSKNNRFGLLLEHVVYFRLKTFGSAARDPHGIKQITVGPPHGIKQITMFIRENVECLDSSFTTTTTIKPKVADMDTSASQDLVYQLVEYQSMRISQLDRMKVTLLTVGDNRHNSTDSPLASKRANEWRSFRLRVSGQHLPWQPKPHREGRVGFSQGIHMWTIHWPAQLDGLHPIVGDDEDDDEDVVGVDGGRLPPDEEAGGQAAVAVRGRNRGAVARRGRVRRGAVAARGRRRHVMVPEVPDGGGRAPPAAVVPGAEAVEALPVFAAAVPVPPPGPVVFPAPQALPVVPPIPYFLMVVDGAALQAPVLPPVPVVGQQLVINHCLVCLEHKAAMMVAVPCGHPVSARTVPHNWNENIGFV